MTIVPGRPPNAVDPNDPEFVSYYDPGGTSRVGPKSSVDPDGGGSAGTPIVRKFPFAFDTPDLLTGAALYTPTVGDILLDAWIEIDTAWDGTTPIGDFGYFALGGLGLFRLATEGETSAVAMDEADENLGGYLVNSGRNSSLLSIQNVDGVVTSVQVSETSLTTMVPYTSGPRLVPLQLTTADPIKVCVSQDGTNTGADPGSSQGAAILYLVTCTPV